MQLIASVTVPNSRMADIRCDLVKNDTLIEKPARRREPEIPPASAGRKEGGQWLSLVLRPLTLSLIL